MLLSVFAFCFLLFALTMSSDAVAFFGLLAFFAFISGREQHSSWWTSCFWWTRDNSVTPLVSLPEKKDTPTEKDEIAALKKEIDALKNVYDDRVSTLESELANVKEQNILSLQNSELTSSIEAIKTYLGKHFHDSTNPEFVAKYNRKATIDDHDPSARVNLIYHQLQKIEQEVQEKNK